MRCLRRLGYAASLAILSSACTEPTPEGGSMAPPATASIATPEDAPFVGDELDVRSAGPLREDDVPMDPPRPPSSNEAPAKGVPVLLFHSICASTCAPHETYGTTADELTRMLTMLAGEGFATISIAQYASFLNGKAADLPPRPILITFDDGRRDAWLGATGPLLAAKARAVMYVITAGPGGTDTKLMSWAEIEAAATSGAWDMQLHAHACHTFTQVGVSEDGLPEKGHAYAWRRYLPETGEQESFEAWRSRVESDLAQGDALLAAHVPDYVPYTFAVPFGDYGQWSTNDSRIPIALRSMFDERFAAWFTQPWSDPPFTKAGGAQEKYRYTIRRSTTAEDLRSWLQRRDAR